MNKKTAIILVSVIIFLFILIPFICCINFFVEPKGYKSLAWGTTESDVKEWIKKNNTNYNYSACKKSHSNVECYNLSFKEKITSDIETVEFQFKDDLLYSVVETNKPIYTNDSQSEIFRALGFGSPSSAKDINQYYQKENGIRYFYIERLFEFDNKKSSKNGTTKSSVTIVIRSLPNDQTVADEVVAYQVTKYFFSE